jgi:hypothetical protein
MPSTAGRRLKTLSANDKPRHTLNRDKSEEKVSLWSPRCRSNNIHINLKETECENTDRTGLSQNSSPVVGFSVLVNELQVP